MVSIRPFLTVSHGKDAVEFYMTAFKANLLNCFDISDGKISAVLEIDGAIFYVGDEEPEHGNLAPTNQHSNSVRIILETENADDLFANALRLGAHQICPMTSEEDWRIGKLQDPFGHIWELGYNI